jgi:hypothetical protein
LLGGVLGASICAGALLVGVAGTATCAGAVVAAGGLLGAGLVAVVAGAGLTGAGLVAGSAGLGAAVLGAGTLGGASVCGASWARPALGNANTLHSAHAAAVNWTLLALLIFDSRRGQRTEMEKTHPPPPQSRQACSARGNCVGRREHVPAIQVKHQPSFKSWNRSRNARAFDTSIHALIFDGSRRCRRPREHSRAWQPRHARVECDATNESSSSMAVSKTQRGSVTLASDIGVEK